jgi:hypothetical protein
MYVSDVLGSRFMNRDENGSLGLQIPAVMVLENDDSPKHFSAVTLLATGQTSL